MSKKRFFAFGQYRFYVLDNRNGRIEGAEKKILVLDLSYITKYQLNEMTEQELFDAAEDKTPLVSAIDL